MKLRKRFNTSLLLNVIVVVLVSFLLVGTTAIVGMAEDRLSYVPNEYIIHVQSGTTLKAVEQVVGQMGASVINVLPQSDTYLIKLGKTQRSAKASASQTISKYVIDRIQPNFKYYPTAVEPNDEFYVEHQWDMRMINMPEAWEIEKGKGNVIVAVNDTGVGRHPELIDRLLQGFDFVDNDNDPSNDTVGHGTHVAGTIAAQGNNNIGISGVCWDDVKILPIRIMGDQGGSSDTIISGLDYALKNGADVVNMSYGVGIPGMPDEAERQKMAELKAAGIILVAAAGNNAADLSAPAMYDECIAVASVGPSEAIAPYSSFGPGYEVDIAAPGGDGNFGAGGWIWSTTVSWAGDPAVATFGYAGTDWQGTSMACPHVAGAAALLLSSGVPSNQVRNKLIQSARPPSTGSMDRRKYGAGILDVAAALSSANIRIIAPTKGAAVSSNPHFKITMSGVNVDTVKVYLDYAGADGVPDNINSETPVLDSSNNTFMNIDQSAIEFDWTKVIDLQTQQNQQKLVPGQHFICVTADSNMGGKKLIDWSMFTVANKIISRGIHLFAFPYELDTSTTTPSDILQRVDNSLPVSFANDDPDRSVLTRWVASTGQYDVYNPADPFDTAWMNPRIGSNPTGGGFLVGDRRTLKFPAGSGFWLILNDDAYINESFFPINAPKGFSMYLYKGWNIIGNPYASSRGIPWKNMMVARPGYTTRSIENAQNAGWISRSIYGYRSTGETGYYMLSNKDFLQPYEGYWIRSLVGGTSTSNALVLTILP